MDPLEPRIRLPQLSESPTCQITFWTDHAASNPEFITPPRRKKPRTTNRCQNTSNRPKGGITLNIPEPMPVQSGLLLSPSPNFPSSSPIFAPTQVSHFPQTLSSHIDPLDFQSDNLPSFDPSIAPQLFDQSIPSGQVSNISDSYEHFVEAVFGQVCAIHQLSERLFVVNGWNNATKTVISHTWYHLSRISINGETQVVCMCPTEKVSGTCFHGRFIREYEAEQFPFLSDVPVSDTQPFLISRIQTLEDSIYDNVLSVPAQNNPTLRNRAIVQFTGNDEGLGSWTCNKHAGAVNCPHIFDARHSFQQIITSDAAARDLYATSPELTYQDIPIRQAGARIDESVSFQTRPVPAWARLSTDGPTPQINPLSTSPELISHDPEASTCCCNTERVIIDPGSDIIRRPCIIYGLTAAWSSYIEVQKCSMCKRRYIGPDCCDIGLFNWNNSSLFSHELLDDYTSFFTTSETPFTAWVTVISRRYPSDLPFVHEKLFRVVWFSYVRLIQFDMNTLCQKCGSDPEAIIFDGVSLAFNRKNMLSSLRPPTTIHADSTVRQRTVRAKKLQLLPDISLRKRICRVLVGPSLFTIQTSETTSHPPQTTNPDVDESDASAFSSDSDTPNQEVHRNALKRKQALLERIQLIPNIISSLNGINTSLGSLFERHFGTISNRPPNQVYSKLFIQISAEETALQMMNYRALNSLHMFLRAPSRLTASNLTLMPALYNVLQHEISTLGGINPDTFGTASWLYIRREVVRQTLLVHQTDPPNSDIQDLHCWQSTGCYYGMPQIRHRPQYPQLKEDQAREPGRETTDGCRKYFSTYSPKKLTGGIMVAWCSHSVSYGFHCIPIAEGRNDVFSALYTCWRKAPSIVVYDFACALQPYCMLREPEFFQDTLFVIDAFHAKDHSKCCPSSFLTTYCDPDPRLLMLNSSAGECGNSGLGRIRKAVSYMSQDRAVMFCMVFLAIWNRNRIKQMEKGSV